MSMNNRVFLFGRLGQDPELKAAGSTQVCRLSVATDESYKDKSGSKVDKVEWHRCSAFGKTAEMIAKYFKKGDLIRLEGRIETRSWEKDGAKQYSTEIVVEQFGFVPGAKGGERREQSKNPYDSNDDDQVPF